MKIPLLSARSPEYKKLVLGVLIAAMVVVLDTTAKYWIQDSLDLYEEIHVIEGFFNINYVHNLGAAFGLLSGLDSQIRKYFFLITTSSAVAVIIILLKRNKISQIMENIALSLILGGAIGNALNRAHLGYVIDFLHFHWREKYHFPSFNLADVAICVGVGILLLHQLLPRRADIRFIAPL